MLAQLFLSFLQVGAFSIGGGYAAMPLIQSQVVERFGWLTMEEFTNLITIAEMTPGPIAVNSATFVGLRIGGVAGALIATFGCILPSLILVSLLSWAYAKYRSGRAMQTVLSLLRPVVVALITSAALDILFTAVLTTDMLSPESLSVDWVNVILFGVALLLLRRLKANPIAVMAWLRRSICACCRALRGHRINTYSGAFRPG